MSSQAVLLLIQALGSEDGRKILRGILITLAAVLSAVVLLFAAILDILTAPFQYDGVTGEFQEKYAYLVASSVEAFGDPLSEEEIETMAAGATGDPDRQEILRTALSLVGRVPYFWGGKSASGWNDEWNTLKQVTVPGVSSYGSLRPYGLDCSGFTDWVWRTAGYRSIGSGVHAQFWACPRIRNIEDDNELQPGDLVFKNWPDNSVINHVGIYYGKDAEGNNLYIHCSSGAGGVVVNGYSGFVLWGRPNFERRSDT